MFPAGGVMMAGVLGDAMFCAAAWVGMPNTHPSSSAAANSRLAAFVLFCSPLLCAASSVSLWLALMPPAVIFVVFTCILLLLGLLVGGCGQPLSVRHASFAGNRCDCPVKGL